MLSRTWIRIALVLALLGVACADASSNRLSRPTSGSLGVETSQAGSLPAGGDTTGGPVATVPTVAPVATPTAKPQVDLDDVQFNTGGWKTDFSKHSVPLDEILPGGPPRDGIPPIDAPQFVSVEEAGAWLTSREPLIHLAVGEEVRAYPLQILIWHEIVNDTLGDVPVAVTFCPLCNTAIAFDRRVAGRTLDFGTSGNLRNSDLVMWDRQTESWWQQITGEAIVGELTGRQLTMLPATIVSWQEFKQQFPRGEVLSRETGHSRPYGNNPYEGYDKADEPPFLFEGKLDGRLPPKERVVTVSLGGQDVAYPFTLLAKERVITDSVGGQAIVVFFQPGTASALDAATLAASRDAGATGVHQPQIDGRRLAFSWRNDGFIDAETGSRWTVLGKAVEGPLKGKQLEPVVHGNHFWFAWAAFKPNTRVYTP